MGIALLVIGLVIGAIAGYAFSLPETSRLQSILAPPTLAEGAVQQSELIAGRGEHWAVPSNLPLGPIYLVHDGEVIGIEFQFTVEMMNEVTIPGSQEDESFLELAGLSVTTFVDHVIVEFQPLGHLEFEVPHYDLYVYFISQEERHELVPHGH